MSRTVSVQVLAAAVALLAGCATAPEEKKPATAATAGAPAPRVAGAQAPSPVGAPAAARAAAATPPAGAASAPAGGARPPAAGAAPAAQAQPPGPPPPPAFATVIRDAKRIEGLISAWQKEDKVWLELRPEDFGQPMFLSPKISKGIGEAGLFGGTMAGRWARYGRPQIVEFQRVHNQVRLIARNTEYIARDGTPTARAIASGFSVSLLGSTTVASQPHPERKTILVEANPLFLADLQGLGMSLQRTFRQNYSLDARHSTIQSVRGKPDALVIETLNHYASPSVSLPQWGAAPSPGPQPTTPMALPDARSLFMGVHYTLMKLPEQPMKPRLSDPRVGYFTTTVNDFTDDLPRTPRQRFVNRWRLEKKDPAAELSEPVKPITYWIDRTIPLEYRGAITDGILEWNKAFEKIGFKDAIVVKVQPDDADFDTLDAGVASVRWMTNARPNFGAIGPSHVDPRTGEILDADIGFESLSSRNLRALRSQILTGPTATDWGSLMQARDALREGLVASPLAGQPAHVHSDSCNHADQSLEQLGYALDVLEARGDLDPDGPEAREFVLGYLKDVTMHEVGHTLGLRHNFRSSRIYTQQQLADFDFTRVNSLAGSVMEYAPINLPKPGQKGGTLWQLALGPYDYWAIEYAYKPVTPEKEREELARVAARSGDPLLAYGTDEDNYLGIDNESLHFDLGSDVVAFANQRIEIARDLIARQERRELKPDADYAVLRRAVNFAVRDVGRAAGVLARQIGGVRTLRDFPGTGRDPLVPVDAATQRAALETLAKGVLAADSFKLSPQLQRRLAPDFEERGEALGAGDGPVQTDYSIVSVLLEMQRTLLAQLMSEGVATRVLDSEGKAMDTSGSFRLSELYSRLTAEVWSELDGRGDIPGPRRELQREHVNRLAAMLLRPTQASRADARSLLRLQARELLARMQTAAKRKDLSAEARAHLLDSADSLEQALTARMQRQGA